MISSELPKIAFVDVLTPGGPFGVGDRISLAFTSPAIGMLASHRIAPDTSVHVPELAIVPETISTRVTRAAGPYAIGDVLTLAFIDPSVARIHVMNARRDPIIERRATPDPTNGEPVHRKATLGVKVADDASQVRDETAPDLVTISVTEVADSPSQGASTLTGPNVKADRARTLDVTQSRSDDGSAKGRPQIMNASGLRVRLDWNRDRVRRFIQVVDKLFTVDRLGWYRHVFAMRLLVPDVITYGASDRCMEALRHLHALRADAVETLGRPLLAAFMPNFNVSVEWLDSLDRPASARAIAGLRDVLTPVAIDEDAIATSELDPAWTIGCLVRADFENCPSNSVEAMLPVLIATASPLPDLHEKLTAYRSALLEIFGQTTQSAVAVRTNQMAQPNHALDDRLWQLVGAVNTSFNGLAVA